MNITYNGCLCELKVFTEQEILIFFILLIGILGLTVIGCYAFVKNKRK